VSRVEGGQGVERVTVHDLKTDAERSS